MWRKQFYGNGALFQLYIQNLLNSIMLWNYFKNNKTPKRIRSTYLLKQSKNYKMSIKDYKWYFQ